jgi:hexosaminidase
MGHPHDRRQYRPGDGRVLQERLDEVIEVFPFEYIHLGGDEVRSMDDRVVGGDHAVAGTPGGQGRKVAVWDELLDSDPPRDLLFFGWRDATKAPAARKAGYEAVSCPQEHCYFDWAESDREDEPLAIAGYVPLEQVYAFEPGDVTGVQAICGVNTSHAGAGAVARLSEAGGPGGSRMGKADFVDFSQRLPEHLELLTRSEFDIGRADHF